MWVRFVVLIVMFASLLFGLRCCGVIWLFRLYWFGLGRLRLRALVLRVLCSLFMLVVWWTVRFGDLVCRLFG